MDNSDEQMEDIEQFLWPQKGMRDIAKELAEKIIHAQRQYSGGQFYSILEPTIRAELDPLLQAADEVYYELVRTPHGDRGCRLGCSACSAIEDYKKVRQG